MKKKILIIDDEQDILEILKTIVEHADYEALLAGDGEEGIKKAVMHKPDLIVTDVMMPGMDGYELTAKLKESPETFKIPVIMLTAKDQPVDREKGLALGVAAYIVKLFDLDELTATINDVLNAQKY